MKGIEVWINGEKKCVAGTDGHVLTAIVHASTRQSVSVIGMVEKAGQLLHADWLNAPLAVGDEVLIRLVETDEVDTPTFEKPSQTQEQQDAEVLAQLRSTQALLPSMLLEVEAEQLARFEQQLQDENFTRALHILGELGEKHALDAAFWKNLNRAAFLLRRYDDTQTYRAREQEALDREKPIEDTP